MPPRSGMEAVKRFLYVHFERVLVMGLVLSLLLIHWFIDYKLAFLSFYYLPIIAAGFLLGRKAAVMAAVFVVALVFFFQAVPGLFGEAGLSAVNLYTLIPWGGFLILTGHVVGSLADQRQERVEDLKAAYLAMLELLTFHLESGDRALRGHSHRVARLAVLLGTELGLRQDDLENLRVAALLHEVGPRDPRLLRLLSGFPGTVRELPLAGAMRGAVDILRDYERYYEVVGDDWPVEHLEFSPGTTILAVADSFETLQAPTPLRPAFAPWSAIDEIARGVGRLFAADVVDALRRVSAVPPRGEAEVVLSVAEVASV